MLLIDVSGVEEFGDRGRYLIEEGLRGDRDVLVGDDRGLSVRMFSRAGTSRRRSGL
ncbi:hypothetical protein ACGF5C_32825 [Micromonospora sp. NPDC047620]|uniref:hypothetical protein n=1 Tax=Micromonospora sp. NPDC047620 TaxID=3364251 RepID=UPI003715D3A7